MCALRDSLWLLCALKGFKFCGGPQTRLWQASGSFKLHTFTHLQSPFMLNTEVRPRPTRERVVESVSSLASRAICSAEPASVLNSITRTSRCFSLFMSKGAQQASDDRRGWP